MIAPGRSVSYVVGTVQHTGRVLVYLDASAVLVSDKVSTTQRLLAESALTDLTPPPPAPTPTPVPPPPPAPVPTPTPADGRYVPLPVPTGLAVVTGKADPPITSNTEYVGCTFGDFEPANVSNIVFRDCTFGYFGLRGPAKLWFIGGTAGRTLPTAPPTYSCDIKGWDGRLPTDIYFERFTFQNMKQTRTGDHVEGLHVYGCNGLALIDCNGVNNDIMQVFVRCGPENSGRYTPISNVLIRGGTWPQPGAGGYYAIRVAGDGDPLVPKNVVIDRTGMTVSGISIDQAAKNNGCMVVN